MLLPWGWCELVIISALPSGVFSLGNWDIWEVNVYTLMWTELVLTQPLKTTLLSASPFSFADNLVIFTVLFKILDGIWRELGNLVKAFTLPISCPCTSLRMVSILSLHWSPQLTKVHSSPAFPPSPLRALIKSYTVPEYLGNENLSTF